MSAVGSYCKFNRCAVSFARGTDAAGACGKDRKNMKCLRKLFRGYLGMVGGIAVLGIILTIPVVFAGRNYMLELLFFFLLLVFLVFVGLVVFGIVVLSQYEKVKQELWKIPYFSEERMEREAARAPRIQNMVLCSDAICYYGTVYLPQMIPLQNIVWAYQGQNPKEGFGLVICTRDGEKTFVPLIAKSKQREPALRYVLRLIARKNKGALIGYRQEYEHMFYSDFKGLLFRVQEGGVADSLLLEQEYLENDYYTKDFQ